MDEVHSQILAQIAARIVAVERPHPVRVAVDGVDAAGKTILADALVPFIEARGRPVIRASVDGFHNRSEIRYQRGGDSPEGYYRDSFNYAALLQDLLLPLGPGGNRQYRKAVFSLAENAPTHEPARAAPPNAILLFDGVFLLRPELIEQWDFSIFNEECSHGVGGLARPVILPHSAGAPLTISRNRWWKRRSSVSSG